MLLRVFPGVRLRCWASLWMALAASLLVAENALAQSGLAAGKLLVASRNLLDPNFAETVVLLVHHNDAGTVGLVVNRRTKVPLSRLFEELKEAKGRTDQVYLGGPVERTGVLALLRSRAKPEDAHQVLSDVYVISNKTLLEKTMAAGTAPDAFRVYLGYAGWAAGQLEMELQLGSWHIFRADAGMVFDPEPGSLWSRLIAQTQRRIALGVPIHAALGLLDPQRGQRIQAHGAPGG